MKMGILPKLIYMFNAIPIKIPKTFKQRLKNLPQSSFGSTKTPNIQGKMSKKKNAGGVTIPNFKLYYKVIAKKPAWYWHKNRHEDQWHRIKDPDMNQCSYAHLIF
jgi:hypothetical protein